MTLTSFPGSHLIYDLGNEVDLTEAIVETIEKWEPEDILRNLTNFVLVDKLNEFNGFHPSMSSSTQAKDRSFLESRRI